jgi:uncharacterized iron-regulated membrane protein
MKLFSRIVFWVHLAVGIGAGTIILIMSVTGMALAFDPQLTAWAEADSRTIAPAPATASRLALDETLARAEAARPGEEATALTLYPDASAAVRVALGREGGVFVDPYRGDVRVLGGQSFRAISRFMLRWHRWLGAEGDKRELGKAIKSAATLALVFMAVSGLYLWWPRRWSWRALRGSLWFRRGLVGRARDWNWHNTFGFWALPAILVVTISGTVLAYDWATALVFKAAGEVRPAGAPRPGPAPAIPARPPGTPRAGLDAIFATLARETPSWTEATLRLRNGREERGRRPRGDTRGAREGGGSLRAAGSERAGEAGPRALLLLVKQANSWPRGASQQIWIDPFSGAPLQARANAPVGPGRRAQIWLRFLHTGEALGWPGQLAALLCTLACALLVWTGGALSWRRLARHRGVAGSRRRGVVRAAAPAAASGTADLGQRGVA